MKLRLPETHLAFVYERPFPPFTPHRTARARRRGRCGPLTAAFLLAACSPVQSEIYIDADEAAAYPGFRFQGEYAGHIKPTPDSEPVEAGLQVAVYGENRFRAMLHTGGLPGDRERPDSEAHHVEMEGTYQDHVLRLTGETPLEFRYIHGRFTALDEDHNYRGHLNTVRRESPTLGMEPPEDAVVLFDGSSLDLWADGAGMTEDGLLREGARTAQEYGDMYLHLEAKLAFMPEAVGQNRANSGVYLQNRYEVQILDSFALPPDRQGNAALYNVKAPDANTSYPPLAWQTYDVFFRAPRFDTDGNKTENVRITAYLNGVLVHDNVELERGTGAGGSRPEVPKGELYLQNHGDPVRFRNVWIVEGASSPPAARRLE